MANTYITMLYARQRLLLALLDAMSEPLQSTDMQKLLFLYTHEWETKPSYEFVPYSFGGFSFSSYADKRRLIERGLLINDEHRWGLTLEGKKAAQEASELLNQTRLFNLRHEGMRGDALIAELYKRYPYYATRSKIASRVLKNTDDLKRIETAKPAKKAAGIVTIGYEAKSLEHYLNQLIRDTVTLLCDVRRNPLSRKYGFSKTTLKNACEKVGIRYVHLPQLGINSEDRRNLTTQADYDALFEEYERTNLPKQSDAIGIIRQWVESGERVALTCYEALPCQCHRHCVADALGGITATHL